MSLERFQTKARFKKFKKHFLVICGFVIILLLIITYMGSEPTTNTPKEKVTITEGFSAIKPVSTTPTEIMLKRLDELDENQKKINQQNLARIAELEAKNSEYQQIAVDAESKAQEINNRLALLNTIQNEPASVTIIQEPSKKMIFEDDINDDQSDSSSDIITETEEASETPNINPNKALTYIPSNSFAKGELISALSANTGGNSNANPTPVLIRITDFAQLPNEFRSNIKSCLVGGTGYGDLSTERVKIRLTTLSCISNIGKAIDIPVSGYIAGEDSKADLHGEIVTHAGSLAAKSALAGFIQGVGQIGQAIGQTQQVTPLGGVTTTISPSQALYSGAGSGISNVGSTLSQYYMNMLQQISPAIEIAAGRHVTIIFTKGFELNIPISDSE